MIFRQLFDPLFNQRRVASIGQERVRNPRLGGERYCRSMELTPQG